MPYRSTIRTCRFVGDVDETMHDELVYMKDNQGIRGQVLVKSDC